jgi:P27 family predicted phage terminase small subunit
MARPAKDETLHDLQGTVSRSAGAQPSRFAGGRPKMPKHLSAVAAEKWREMIRLLNARGTLTRADGPALEVFCETWARWRACLQEIETHGVMVTVEYAGANGEPCSKRVQNPAAKLAAQLEVSMRQMLKELGSTPASREKAKPARPDPKAKKPPAPGSIGDIAPELVRDGGDPDPIIL